MKEKIDDVLNDINAESKMEIKSLDKAGEEISRAKKKIPSLSVSNQMVVLNVGGKKFATTVHTLTMLKNTMFAGMFSGYFDGRRDGKYFFDRSPKHFEIILNYLRNQHSLALQKMIISLNHIEIEEIFEEADYYGIVPLLELLNALPIKANSAKEKKWRLILSSPDTRFQNNVKQINNHNKSDNIIIESGVGTGYKYQDYIRAVFEKKVIVTRVIVAATSVGGTDETFINGAIFQVENDIFQWEDVFTVAGVTKNEPKSFVITPVSGQSFRFLHGKSISSDKCLALGILIFE